MTARTTPNVTRHTVTRDGATEAEENHMHTSEMSASAERMRRKRARDAAAKPRLRIVDGDGGDVELPPIEQLVLLGDQLRTVVGAFAAQLVDLEPEQARCRIDAAEARAAAADARAVAAAAEVRDAVAAADEADERAEAAHQAAVAATERLAVVEQERAALAVDVDRFGAELVARTAEVEQLTGAVAELETRCDAERQRSEQAELARAQLAQRLDRLLDAFAAAAAAGAGS